MGAYPNRAAPYVGVYSKPVYMKLGPLFGMQVDPATNACLLAPDSGQNAGPGCDGITCNRTNPINPAWRGNKYQVERDYAASGVSSLAYIRYYNSRASRVAGLSPIAPGQFDCRHLDAQLSACGTHLCRTGCHRHQYCAIRCSPAP